MSAPPPRTTPRTQNGPGRAKDGNFVLTWVDGALTIYDTRSGDEVPPDQGPYVDVLAAEFGPDNTISYLVMHRQQSNGVVNIRTCSLGQRLANCSTNPSMSSS